MTTFIETVRWFRKGKHWDKVVDPCGVLISERLVGPALVTDDNFVVRHVLDADICSKDGLCEYWEILGRVVDPGQVPSAARHTHRLHKDAVPVMTIDQRTFAQLRQFLPYELGKASEGKIYLAP